MTAHASITRIGRWQYRVEIVDGLLSFGPDGIGWHRFGRKRAEALARRVLARYVRRRGWEQTPEIVTGCYSGAQNTPDTPGSGRRHPHRQVNTPPTN